MADEPERIELERTGGFANIRTRTSLSANALTPPERAGIEALLSRTPAEGTMAGAPDRYQYDVTVVGGGRQHHVRLGEQEIDEQLRPLIDRLERAATPK